MATPTPLVRRKPDHKRRRLPPIPFISRSRHDKRVDNPHLLLITPSPREISQDSEKFPSRSREFPRTQKFPRQSREISQAVGARVMVDSPHSLNTTIFREISQAVGIRVIYGLKSSTAVLSKLAQGLYSSLCSPEKKRKNGSARQAKACFRGFRLRMLYPLYLYSFFLLPPRYGTSTAQKPAVKKNW